QIREVRDLIKELGQERTVILSTHILPEVEMICGKVIILARGRVMAQDTPERLRDQLEGRRRVVCEVRGPLAEVTELLEKVPGIGKVEAKPLDAATGTARYDLEVIGTDDVREAIAQAVLGKGFGLR